MEEKTTENLEVFYDPSINIQIDPSLIENSAPVEPKTPSFNAPKNKKKSLIVLIILIVILLSAVSVSYASIVKKDNAPKDEPPINDPTPTEPDQTPSETTKKYETIKLADLSKAFNNLSSVKEYNTLEGYSMSSAIRDNSLVVIIKSDTETEITFELKDNILTKTTTIDDGSSALIFIYLETAKAILDGFNETEAMTALSDSSASTMTLDKNGSEITSTPTGMTLNLALNKKIVLLDLKNEYVTTKDLEAHIKTLKGTGSINGHSGHIYYYYNYNLNTPEIPAQATLLIAEPKNFTSLTYNSLLTFIKTIYNDTEANNFKTLYPSIQEGTFGKYTFSVNPANENYNSYYNKGYVVLEVKFIK